MGRRGGFVFLDLEDVDQGRGMGMGRKDGWREKGGMEMERDEIGERVLEGMWWVWKERKKVRRG